MALGRAFAVRSSYAERFGEEAQTHDEPASALPRAALKAADTIQTRGTALSLRFTFEATLVTMEYVREGEQNLVRKRLLQCFAGSLLAAVAGVTVWAAWLYADHGSLLVRCGTVPPGKTVINDSQGMFQEISWHFGNGLRTWGRTYAVQVGEAYVSLQVTHVNSKVTPEEAREDE
jgi:hypothetical protein